MTVVIAVAPPIAALEHRVVWLTELLRVVGLVLDSEVETLDMSVIGACAPREALRNYVVAREARMRLGDDSGSVVAMGGGSLIA